MIKLEPAKRSVAVRDYRHDWGPFLGSDTIATQQSTASGGITLDNVVIEAGNTAVKFWVSGGLAGETGLITHRITTAGGRTETEVFAIHVVGADEPVSVAELKRNMKIEDDNSEDELIASLGRSARAFVEDESGFIFVRRQLVQVIDKWPSSYIELDYRPVVTIDEIEYTGSDYTPVAYENSFAMLERNPARIYPAPGSSSWPTLPDRGYAVVRYTAGFPEGSQANEYELARQAIFLLVGHWYANRETSIDKLMQEIPFGVKRIIDRFRAQVL